MLRDTRGRKGSEGEEQEQTSEGDAKGGREGGVPSVSASATRKRLKGGRRRRALSIAEVIARMMYGATILKICKDDKRQHQSREVVDE